MSAYSAIASNACTPTSTARPIYMPSSLRIGCHVHSMNCYCPTCCSIYLNSDIDSPREGNCLNTALIISVHYLSGEQGRMLLFIIMILHIYYVKYGHTSYHIIYTYTYIRRWFNMCRHATKCNKCRSVFSKSGCFFLWLFLHLLG